MKNVMGGIEMTMETKEDFDGKWLPTLDISLSVTSGNRLQFKHFEKPTCSNLTMQKKSAMEQNMKMGILSNEVIRRLFNSSENLDSQVVWETLDKYAIKLLTSGHSLAVTRRVILNGIRGFETKIKRLEQRGIPRYRTADESGKNRSRKKIMGKSTWFKGGGGKHSNLGTRNSGGGRIGGGKKSKVGCMRVFAKNVFQRFQNLDLWMYQR